MSTRDPALKSSPRVSRAKRDRVPRQVIHPRISYDLYQRLKAYCARRRVSESAVVNAALLQYLDQASDAALIMRRLDRRPRTTSLICPTTRRGSQPIAESSLQPSYKVRDQRDRPPSEGVDFREGLSALTSAGWTGLEPAASGVTGGLGRRGVSRARGQVAIFRGVAASGRGGRDGRGRQTPADVDTGWIRNSSQPRGLGALGAAAESAVTSSRGSTSTGLPSTASTR